MEEDLKWILKFMLYVTEREEGGGKIKRERKENPQWALTLFRNSKSQQCAQGCQMHVIIVAGDPWAQGKAQVRPGQGWHRDSKQALKSSSNRALKTVHNLSSHVFKCSAERRLLFWKFLSVLSFNRKSIYHLFSRKQTPVLQDLCSQV